MTDQEFILCKWKRRLWPAKVLCKPGVAGSSPDATPKRMGFKAEILGLEKQVSVSSANVVPLTEERIKAIASTLEQKKTMSEAVEELQYRCSLKIALDILQETDSSSQMPPAEGPNPEFSREKSAPPTPSHGFLLRSRSKKSEHEAAKRKRKPQNNCELKDGPKARSQGGSVAPGRSGKAPGSGTSPARYSARDSSVAPAPDSHNCKKPEPKSSPRQKKIQPKMGNGVSCKSEAGRSQQGRKRCRDDSPQDQAQVAPEEGSPSVPSKSGTVEPSRKKGTQPGRAFLDSSCETASDELEKSISSESESLAKQLDGRREAEGGKHLDGAAVASGTDRKCRNHPGSSPGPSGAFPQPPEEENQDPSHLAGNKAPDSEEDEGGEGKPSSHVGGEPSYL